jgi:phosphohistidine phosphatase
MTADLYLLRHGIAVDPGAPGMRDLDRPLTPKGEKRIKQIARCLARLDLKLERIATSPLLRARATAEIVARELGLRHLVETSDVLAVGSSADAIDEWLRERHEERLLLVGHNPTLSDLIALLVAGSDRALVCDLKKGGIAALTRLGSTSTRFTIDWIATPRLLRRLT